MSASNKKKLRREQDVEKLTEKQLAEKKEAKKLKIYTVSVCAILALILVAFIGIIVANSGILHRNTTAMKVGDHKISSVELNYNYIDTVTAFANQYGNYIGMFGLNPKKPLDKQIYSEEKGETWADYFMTEAANSVHSTYALYDAAVAAGHTLTEEEQQSVEDAMSTIASNAKQSGFADSDAFLKAVYGPGSTAKIYRQYCETQAMAMSYYNAHRDSLTYEDADLRARDEENPAEFTAYTYNTYYLDRSKFLEGGTEDEEGNTTYSDEEKAAALAAAEEAAKSLTTCKTLEDFDKAIAGLSINADKEDVSSTAYTEAMYAKVSSIHQEWVSSADRKAGDMTYIANTSKDADGNEVINGYYVLYFTEANDNTFALANVRHLLVSFEGGTKDQNGNTTYSDAEKAEAKEKAEALLAEWKNGDATEDSFAALATEKTTDTGSKENGGLYEDIYPGQMVESFNDWCFDEARKPGDTGIVETEYGYHIMFYVSDSETNYRDFMIENALVSADMEAWSTEIVENSAMDMKRTTWVRTDLVLQSK